MRWFPSRVPPAALLAAAALAVAARAEAPSWLQWLPGSSPASQVLYRVVPAPSGPVPVRRPPAQTAPELARLSAEDPSDTALMALTARQYEALLDFAGAEAHWERFAAASEDPAAGRIALADYYHRRMEPERELEALAAADALLPAVEDPLVPEDEQRAWMLHERVQSLIEAQAQPVERAAADYEAWIGKYPAAEDLHRRYFDFLIESGMPDAAAGVLDRYRETFPGDAVFPVRARAALAEARGSEEDAIAIYDAAFDPLWPEVLLEEYFRRLRDSRRLFDFHQEARAAALERPLDLEAAARLFHYYLRSQFDRAAGRRELAEFRIRKESAGAGWEADELLTLARLAGEVDDHDEAIRYAYALYSLPGAEESWAETALVEIIATLLGASDQPIRFGRGDLSFYRDIATMDASPGFLNGILSLIFNSRNPGGEFASQERKSEAYFHRAKADELYALLSERFPDSAHRSDLLSRLIESYARYGEDAAIIRRGTAFIDEFADAPERTRVALQVADAYARRQETPEELAVYDRLLAELAERARGLPLGSGPPRSVEYAEVLQRYISRLTRLERIPEAVALYRREIDRNPEDPGLYDRLADFLGANRRAEEVEQVYRQAMGRFQDASWWHKLARFYLRNRLSEELAALSREMVDAFSGSEVEAYIADVVADGALERRMQLEINRYALDRFPHDLRFVHNLISLYSGGTTADPAALTRLLAAHWYEDEGIRRMYFERLVAGSGLSALTEAARDLLPSGSLGRWEEAEAANPAVTRFLAEAEAWQSHFEEAAPIMRAVAGAYPADPVFAGRASDLYRSLAAYDPAHTSVAVAILENLAASEPRNRDWRIRAGDIYADRGLMAPAIDLWARLPEVEPGTPDGYLETATLFWDYLRPGDALDWLQRGRAALGDPALWPYETGAILESLGRPGEAVREYMTGALGAQSGPSRARLLELAVREDYRELIDRMTAERVEDAPADPAPLRLRVSVLRARQRHAEIEELLAEAVSRTASREVLSYARGVGMEFALRDVQERVIRRQIEIEADPEERLRLRLELARFFESGDDLQAARREIESVYEDHPLISGVIRATADFFWRHDEGRAIEVLRSAAEGAHSSLRPRYLIETARKAVDAGRLPEAVEAAQDLLDIDPIDPAGIALMADALTVRGRDAEVEDLYTAKISQIGQADISEAEKTDRIAAMRRGLIPVLVREGRHSEALDQFVEIVNRYPEDAEILREAGRHALDHDLDDALIGYYSETAEASPRDPRWPIVLARLHTQLEDYPAAIDAYGRAMALRPEREDLALARAGLEERTYRFEDAIASYARLHELSGEDPVWLERIAGLQIRLGRGEEAVAGLRRAYVDDRPEASREYGRAALVLEAHGMIEEAADFVEQQAAVGLARLPGAEQAYGRIMTAARRHPEALDRILDLESDEGARAMGQAAARYLTPEERQAFASLLAERRAAAPEPERIRLMDIARRARLHELEARWLLEESRQAGPEARQIPSASALVALQQRRMRFAELAADLESLARASPVNARSGLLGQAVASYQAIGDTASELMLMEAHSELQVSRRTRYYELLARVRPDALVGDAGRSDSLGLPAARALIDAGERERAVEAIRSQGRSPVWKDAYTGLVGVYFGAEPSEVSPPFERILGSPLVDDRIGGTLDRELQLAGDLWFYYGQRYGEYLDDAGRPEAAPDYLASQIEMRPRDPEAYLELARYYRETGDPARALTRFQDVLELDAARPDVHSDIALLHLDAGRPDEAIQAWARGLEAFEARPDPATGSGIIRAIRMRGQAGRLGDEIESALGAAAGALEVWDLVPLIRAAFEDSTDDGWLLEVVEASRAPVGLLTSLADQPWLAAGQRRLILESAVEALSSSPGVSQFEYRQMRQRYLEHLIGEGDARAAGGLLDSFSTEERRAPDAQGAEIRIAALAGGLEGLIDRYRSAPSEAPAARTLQQAAAALELEGRSAAGRQVREYLYSRQIEEGSAGTTAFLGLAEIRLQEGRPDEAVALLGRLNLLSVTPFEDLTASARLLAEHGQAGRAREFLELRLRAVPWDAEARLELARIELEEGGTDTAAGHLERIVRTPGVPYDVRAEAAEAQARTGPVSGSTGSRELDLLSGRIPMTPEAAAAPHFFAARRSAASEAEEADVRLDLLLGAIAERPDDADVRKRLLSAALDADRHHLALAAYRTSGGIDVEIATGLAEASLEIGEPAEGARYFGIAAAEEPDQERREALEARQREAQAAYERMLEDERRRPVMREDLDQPEPVRRMVP